MQSGNSAGRGRLERARGGATKTWGAAGGAAGRVEDAGIALALRISASLVQPRNP